MKVYLIENEEGSFYQKNLTDLEDLYSEVGETYTITLVEMTEDEFELLPEFDGF